MGTRFRSLVTAGSMAVFGLLAAACGSDDETAAAETLAPASSSAPLVATAAPTVAPTTKPVPTAPPTTNNKATLYKVKAGDGLIKIARAHCVKLDALLYVNPWPEGAKHVLHPDDIITIPPQACRNGGAGDYVAPKPSAPPTTKKK